MTLYNIHVGSNKTKQHTVMLPCRFLQEHIMQLCLGPPWSLPWMTCLLTKTPRLGKDMRNGRKKRNKPTKQHAPRDALHRSKFVSNLPYGSLAWLRLTMSPRLHRWILIISRRPVALRPCLHLAMRLCLPLCSTTLAGHRTFVYLLNLIV